MPDNTLLLLGLGLAAWTIFRNNQQETGEGDLVDASMLSQGTGATGKALGSIPVVNSDVPINSSERSNGANGTTPGFDFVAWLNDIGILPTPAATNTDTPPSSNNNTSTSNVVDEDLPNEKTGPAVAVDVTPFIQTPEYIRTTGELAGTAVRQLGLQRGVDVLNDKIYIQEIQVDDDEGITRIEGPLTSQENVQIVAGGANPGDPYFTTIDFLVAAKEQGYFGPLESPAVASARSNKTYSQSEAPVQEQVTVTGGIPVTVQTKPVSFLTDISGDTYDGGWF